MMSKKWDIESSAAGQLEVFRTEHRRALLITNCQYTNARSLPCVGDGRAIEQQLTQGVDVDKWQTTTCADLTSSEIEAELLAMEQTLQLQKEDGYEPAALFYFSGHGSAVEDHG